MIRNLNFRLRFFAIAPLLLLILAGSSQSQNVEDAGYAGWYNRGSDGNRTAGGETYDHAAMTAAHPFLPFDSMVRVTRLDNGRSVVVRINDRMQTGPGHIIDLSGAAAAKLGLLDTNVARVRLDVEEATDLIQVRETLAARSQKRPKTRSRKRPNAKSVKETVTVAVSGSSRYTLQVGVFSSQPAASAFASGFENGWVAEVSDSGDKLYRVYYNRFSQEQPARIAQQQLKSDGHDSFLRKILP